MGILYQILWKMAFALKCAWKRCDILAADQPAINLSTFFHQSTRSTCSSAAVALAKVATRLKPFSAFSACPCRRVRNHYTKRTLNLILNRKKFLRRENDPLDKQKPRQNRREPSPPCKRRFITLSRSPACSFSLQSGRFASG